MTQDAIAPLPTMKIVRRIRAVMHHFPAFFCDMGIREGGSHQFRVGSLGAIGKRRTHLTPVIFKGNGIKKPLTIGKGQKVALIM